MALVLANRVQESATANTTVSFTLTGAIAGFQSFAVIGDTNTTFYSATDGSGNWEVGLGTYSTTGPTLTRTTIYASSNSNNAVTFSGAVNVFVTYPSGRSVNLDASGNVSALGTVSSGTWQGSTVGVAYGGTGVTASSGANSVVLRDSNSNITVNRVSQANTSTTAAGGTTALTAASSYIHTLVGTGGQTYTLPDATTLTTGVAFVFNNMATGTLTIQNYATGSVGTIPSGGAGAVFLTDNSTTGGTWDIHAYLPEGVTFGTNAFNLGSSVISGGTWQGGTIQPGYGGTGLTTFVGANNALYSTGASTLTAGTLPVAAGGTGRTTYTLNGVLYASGTGTLTNGSALTFDGTTLANINSDGTGFSTQSAASNFSILRLGTDSVNGYAFFQSGKSGTGTTLPFAWRQDSSELMRLTSTGLGIGTSSPARKLDVVDNGNINATSAISNSTAGTSSLARFLAVSDAGSAIFGMTSSSYTDISGAQDAMLLNANSASGGVAFALDGVLRMKLDSSGNLGIGTSSPAAKLHVSGGRTLAITGNENYSLGVGRESNTNAYYLGVHSTSSPNLLFSNNAGTTNMTLTYDGNLGLGVTPSAWDSTYKAIQVGARSMFYGIGSEANMANNAYYNSGYKYVANSAAGLYTIDANVHKWYNAASGTAGNAITFTQAMTLDASGNLGVGTTSPSAPLHVSGSGSLEVARFATTTDNTPSIGIYSNGSIRAKLRASSAETALLSQGALPLLLGTNDTERARITSGGDLLVGTTSAAAKLTVQNDSTALDIAVVGPSSSQAGIRFGYSGATYQGRVLYDNASNYMAFTTNGSERARIDSSGNMGVGTTSPAARLDVVGSTGILTRAAATQDGVALVGRAGGTSSYEVTLTPTTLSADRTLTLPDNSGTVLTSGATVTVAQGGTGATSLTANNVLLGNGTSAVQVVAPGASGNVLTSNGTTWTSAAASSSYVGMRGQAFTSNGTFTIPTGITALKVTVVGGGGGGGGRSSGGCCSLYPGAGGGGGGTAISFLTGLTPGNTLTVTIGGAGSAGGSTSNGGSGGNSTVASGTQTISTITGNGGGGGTASTANAGGAGGTSSGGTINITGGGGSTVVQGSGNGGIGGSSTLGGGGRATTGGVASTAGGAYGGGGAGANAAGGGSGAAGAAGVVLFEW